MPLTLTNPIVASGNTYPFVAVQIIVSPRVVNGGFINSSVFNFTPYRVLPNGTVDALVQDPSATPLVPSVLMSDATASAALDPNVTGRAMAGMLAAIQGYLTGKGI